MVLLIFTQSDFIKSHLEPVINSNIFLLVKVCHGDLQLVGLLARQAVELLEANPTLSLIIIAVVRLSIDYCFNIPLAEKPISYSAQVLSKKLAGLPPSFRSSISIGPWGIGGGRGRRLP